MRIFKSEKHMIIINKKKLVAVFTIVLILLFSVKFYGMLAFYSEELKQMMKVKSNNAFQDVVNNAIYEVCNEAEFVFTDITYNNGLVSAINYNSNSINNFKTQIVKKIINNINAKEMIFKIFLTDVFNNACLVNKGPSFDVRCMPHNAINIECFSKFEDAGVNQTKNTIWFEVTTDIYTSGLVFNTINTFNYSVAVSETIIVGNVPESYTNVSGGDDIQDKVLNLQ